MKISNKLILIVIGFTIGFFATSLISKNKCVPLTINYENSLNRGSYSNKKIHDFILTIETDELFVTNGLPEFYLYNESKLIDNGFIEHKNNNEYILVGSNTYNLCVLQKSLCILYTENYGFLIFDNKQNIVVSFDQDMYK